MKKQVHTISCWLLVISLIWLPFSVSADVQISTTEKSTCHEMNSLMQGETVSDSSIIKSIVKTKCCGHCIDGCTCNEIFSCGHSSNHVSAFILCNQYSSQSYPLILFSIERFVQYHNQIITPDFRPPIV